MTLRITIKGAGVAGLSVAHELAARGAQVHVADPGPGIGAGASWWAGGMLAPYCERENAGEDVVRLGSTAVDWWDGALPGLVERQGTLVVAPPRDTAEIRRFSARTRGFEEIDDEAIVALEPELAGRFRRGLFFRDEAHLDPRRALAALHEKLVSSGVSFAFGSEENAGDYDFIIDCTGFAARSALAKLRGVRGEMLYLETDEISLSRPVRLLHPRIPLYVVPRGNGLFMVGATMIESDDPGPVTARSVMELLNGAYTLHPAFAEARIVETGAGVRPSYEDNLPAITQRGRTIYLNGMHRHGFLLAPAMAVRLADMLIGKNGDEKCA